MQFFKFFFSYILKLEQKINNIEKLPKLKLQRSQSSFINISKYLICKEEISEELVLIFK